MMNLAGSLTATYRSRLGMSRRRWARRTQACAPAYAECGADRADRLDRHRRDGVDSTQRAKNKLKPSLVERRLAFFQPTIRGIRTSVPTRLATTIMHHAAIRHVTIQHAAPCTTIVSLHSMEAPHRPPV